MAIDETLLKSDEKAVYALRSLYRRFGYTQYKMSKFEEYDLYVKNKDFLVFDGVITFTDTNGRLLALKPDVTLSIIKNSEELRGKVQKLYYNENVYRISGSSHTYKEIMQTGLECIGDIGRFETCEVLSLAVKSLEIIDSAFVLELSHVGLTEAALEEFGIPEFLKPEIMNCITRKNRDDLAFLCKNNGIDAATAGKLTVFTENYTAPSDALRAAAKTVSSEKALAALDEFSAVCDVLGQRTTQGKIIIDFSASGGMSYYSGVVFKGYINGIPVPVLSGGRYDKLMRNMNRSDGAIGFAVYLDALERFNLTETKYDVDTVLIIGDDIGAALAASEELSADGTCVAVCCEIPDGLRFRRAFQMTGKGYEPVND